MTLGDMLQTRGFDPRAMVAIRNTLHPDDVSADFRNMADVIAANAASMYDRMQDGPLIAHEALVMSFRALDEGRAHLTGLRTFLLRRQGIVPGDIVYDYDAAHLLHSFIARAAAPCFYDAIEETGLDDLFGQLIVQWPEPLAHNIVPASHQGLIVVAT